MLNLTKTSVQDFLELDRWTLRSLFREHFGSDESRVKEIREAFIEKYYPEFVGFCGGCNQKTFYKHDERRYILYCSTSCKNSSEKFKSTVRSSYEQKYGMSQSEFLNSAAIVEKRNASLGSKATKLKRRATMLERHGVENPMQSDAAKSAHKQTSRVRYGADHHMQNAQQFAKWADIAYKTQAYQTLDGRTLQLQGYEPVVAEALESRGWKVRSPKHGVHYEFRLKQHIYHPDLVISRKSVKYVVEVKSEYTLFDPKSVDRNLVKFKAAAAVMPLALFVVLKDSIVGIVAPEQYTKAQLQRIVAGKYNCDGVWRIDHARNRKK